jgi:hypothetical protein
MISEDRQWFKCKGASAEALAELRQVIDADLPEKYYELMAYTNGGEGALPVFPFLFCLYSVEKAKSSARGRAWSDFPDFFIIGDNGGNELIGFDLQAERRWRIVTIDSMNIDLDACVGNVAPDFDTFLQMIGIKSDCFNTTSE